MIYLFFEPILHLTSGPAKWLLKIVLDVLGSYMRLHFKAEINYFRSHEQQPYSGHILATAMS